MARSECFCNNFSCEPTLKENQRFRFVKEEGSITNRINLNGIQYYSGVIDVDIEHCELRHRVRYQDREGVHEPKNNYCDKGGHKERSLANDHRKKGHKKHWKN